jgi:hypothetical protein
MSDEKPSRTAGVLPTALRDALGQVIAHKRREWRHERAKMEAEARELVAELKRQKELGTARKPFDPDEIVQALGIKLAEVRRSVADAQIQATHREELFEAKMIERLATLHDGRDGLDGVQGAPGERGEAGPPGMLPVVRAWTDAVHGPPFQASAKRRLSPCPDWVYARTR